MTVAVMDGPDALEALEALRGQPLVTQRGRPPRAWRPERPLACGHCGSRRLYLDHPDGDPACLMCGWRQTRAPSARELAGTDYLDLPRGLAR